MAGREHPHHKNGSKPAILGDDAWFRRGRCRVLDGERRAHGRIVRGRCVNSPSRRLTEDEAARIPPLTREQIEAALEEGRLDREAVEAAGKFRVMLPPRLRLV